MSTEESSTHRDDSKIGLKSDRGVDRGFDLDFAQFLPQMDKFFGSRGYESSDVTPESFENHWIRYAKGICIVDIIPPYDGKVENVTARFYVPRIQLRLRVGGEEDYYDEESYSERETPIERQVLTLHDSLLFAEGVEPIGYKDKDFYINLRGLPETLGAFLDECEAELKEGVEAKLKEIRELDEKKVIKKLFA